jgi:acetyl-CoA C-acetyltransferase/potassium large conductance calcium-activated channel subfamily M alpha protein 1
MPIILQLIKPESKNLYYKSLNLNCSRDQLIIVEEIKMNLLAKSCFAPGLISMISNLITSHGDEDIELED